MSYFKAVIEVEDIALSGEKFGKRVDNGIKEGEVIYEAAANAFALEKGFASAEHLAVEIKSLRSSLESSSNTSLESLLDSSSFILNILFIIVIRDE